MDRVWVDDIDIQKILNPEKFHKFSDVNGNRWLTLTWGNYEYDIAMSRIPTPLALLSWIHHLSQKSTKAWPRMTPRQIGFLIADVCRENCWKLYGDGP